MRRLIDQTLLARIYIYCEPDSTAQRLYQKLGFVLAAELVTRSFC